MVAWLDKVVCIVVAFMACPSHGPTVMNGCMTVLCAVGFLCLGHLDKVSHSGLEFWPFGQTGGALGGKPVDPTQTGW